MADITKKIADVKGAEVAVVDEFGTTTWAQLDGSANRLIHAIRNAGIGAGDTVAILCGNRAENFELQVAGGHMGLFMVPVNWHWTGEELAYVLEDSGSKALFVDSRYLDVAVDAVARVPYRLALQAVIGGVAPDDFASYDELLFSAPPDEPEDQTLGGPMFYTSGTTGFPKGVRTSTIQPGMPANLMELVAAGLLSSLHMPEGGTTLLCGPLYHSAQWAWSLLPLLGGSGCVMQHHFDPAEVLDLIDDHEVTNVHLVPTQFIRLLKLHDDLKREFDGSSLACVWHGAAPCSPQVKRHMIEWFGPRIWEYYGGTEGGIISVISSEEWLERPGSVGKVLPTYEVQILDESGDEQPAGEAGQIWFKNLMGTDFEYHNAPEKTASAHRAGGFGTLGDIGHLDDAGHLFLSDRKIDMIISGGVNIYPAEIEGVLVTHAAIRDAAVFGIPHDEMGEEVKAAVELTDGATPSEELERDIIRHVREHLAGYKAPRSVDFEDALPRHPTGKLYKRLLRDRYWEGTGRSM